MKKHALTAKRMRNFQPQNLKSIKRPFHPQNILHKNLNVFSRISIMNNLKSEGKEKQKRKEKRILELLCCLVSIISFVYNFAIGNFVYWKQIKNEKNSTKTTEHKRSAVAWVVVQRRENSTFERKERKNNLRKRNDELTALCNLITSYYSQLDWCLFLSFFDFLRFYSLFRCPTCVCCVRYIVFISFTFFGTFSCGIRSLFHVDVCLIRWRNQTVILK